MTAITPQHRPTPADCSSVTVLVVASPDARGKTSAGAPMPMATSLAVSAEIRQGEQRAGVDLADVDDLNDEDRRGQGCAKERGEQRRHTAKLEHAAVIALGGHQAGHGHADGAAQLQRSALAAGRTAGQVGQRGGNENGGGHLDAYALLGADGLDDLIRTDGQRQLQQPVQSGDHEAGHGHQPGQPGGVLAQMGGFLHHDGECAAHHAADSADCHGHQRPNGKGAGIVKDLFQLELHG